MNAPAREDSSGHLNRGWTYRDRAGAADAGLSVLSFYASRYAYAAEAVWSERIAAGRVLRNGCEAHAAERLARGDELEYHRVPWREPAVPTDFTVLYDDGAILAVDKPTGLPVLPGGSFLESTLLHRVRASAPVRHAASPVHRLGRGTTGVVLFGITPGACRALSEEIRTGGTHKLYLGIARGVDLPDEFEARHPIGLVAHDAVGLVHAVAADGKASLTRFRVLARDPSRECSLVLAQLVTGRTHQIRIHLAACGAPLAGDPFYAAGGGPIAGARALPSDLGYVLHAWSITVSRVGGAERVTVRAPIPRRYREGPFAEAIEQLLGAREAWPAAQDHANS